MSFKNEIILYRPNKATEPIEVRIEDETVWLNQQQLSSLFNQTKQNISLHINNCFKEGELERNSTVKESLSVQIEGKRNVKRNFERFLVDFYSPLNDAEFEGWKSQIVMSNSDKMGFRRAPITITEHRSTKLSSILRRDSAINCAF